MTDAYAQLAGMLDGAADGGRALGGWLLGEVEQAGQGRLQLVCGGLTLDQDEVKTLSGLSYAWTADTGGAELLRQGDRVIVLVSADQQSYYILQKVG